MSLRVIQPGLHSTMQDQGRVGYRAWGVPVGGAFDRRSHDLANALVGNEPAAATIELTLRGGSFRAEASMGLALAGARMPVFIQRASGDRIEVRIPQSFTLFEGDLLEIGYSRVGARTYLAALGGWQTPIVLDSRSSEVPLQAGELLNAEPSTALVRRPAELEPTVGEVPRLRIVAGPDGDSFGTDDPAFWNERSFRVGRQIDRMGLRLETEGPPPPSGDHPNRPSSPITPGAIQLAGGCLIVLGVSCGTMGGYAHIAQVIAADMPCIGQLVSGARVHFQVVCVAEARMIDDTARATWQGALAPIRMLARDRA